MTYAGYMILKCLFLHLTGRWVKIGTISVLLITDYVLSIEALAWLEVPWYISYPYPEGENDGAKCKQLVNLSKVYTTAPYSHQFLIIK